MTSPAAPMQKISVVPLDKKMEARLYRVNNILHLPGGQQIITCSYNNSSLRVWDLESGAQVGEAWTDEGSGHVFDIELSPDGKTIASGSEDGAVRLWDIDTGKVVKKWTGHTKWVQYVSWSPDGQRVVSGSKDETFRVWDVENGETILILATEMSRKEEDAVTVWPVCYYSPDGKMIATGADNYGRNIWDANTGKLLTTLSEDFRRSLAWIKDPDPLISGISNIDTATWQIRFREPQFPDTVHVISISLNERILASVSSIEQSRQTVQLWNFANYQPIGPPLHHDNYVACATFSEDGKLLVTGCDDGYVYIWDVSAILKKKKKTVHKFSLNDDATRFRAPPIRIPRGFFDDTRDPSTMPGVPSDGCRGHHTASSRQWLLGRLPPTWRHRRSDIHGTTEPNPRSQSRPPRLARNLIPDMLCKRNGSDIQSREPPVVEVPCTAGKPRDYHARKRKKPAASSSLPGNLYTTQQSSAGTQNTQPISSFSLPLNPRTMQQSSAATQNTPSSSQQPLVTTSKSLPATATTALTTGTMSQHNITVIQAGCWVRFLLWIGCASIEHTDHEH
ncbi:WD40-repeat-containing domain protein [Suillus clintonianus]|uniref:WD40-repeat-containing domain protein n=1 Tax=Suillus clintonianus TaxID=1904413 RepID=UPI001B86B243|nr:WD40-repeat-containing domain protein [Suillus clintonianus]KAG2125745.1 WD40-repeat-containing domain protein [Suillus clintonianus]